MFASWSALGRAGPSSSMPDTKEKMRVFHKTWNLNSILPDSMLVRLVLKCWAAVAHLQGMFVAVDQRSGLSV